MSDNMTLFETALTSVRSICGSMSISELHKAYKVTQELMDSIFETLHEKAIESSNHIKEEENSSHVWNEEFFEIHRMKPCHNCCSMNDENHLTRGGCSKCKAETNSFCSEKCFNKFHSNLKLEAIQPIENNYNASTNIDILSQLPDLLKANFSSLVSNPMLLPFGSNLFTTSGNNFMNSEKHDLVSALNSLSESQTPSTPKTRGRPRGSSMIATSLRRPRGRPPLNTSSRMDLKNNLDDENRQPKYEVKRRGRPPINGNRAIVSRGRGLTRPTNDDRINQMNSEELSYKRFCPSPTEAENLSSKNYNSSENNNEGHSPASQASNGQSGENRSKTPNSNASNNSKTNTQSNMETILQSLANSGVTSFSMPFLNNAIDSSSIFSQKDPPTPNNSYNALQSNGLQMPIIKNE